MLTDERIEMAKRVLELDYSRHEHNDSVRMAYEWLDAQKKTTTATTLRSDLKHLVERWAGRYVARCDVEIAAYLHPEVFGRYPHYNINPDLIEPCVSRLEGIGEAFEHDYRQLFDPREYVVIEQACPATADQKVLVFSRPWEQASWNLNFIPEVCPPQAALAKEPFALSPGHRGCGGR